MRITDKWQLLLILLSSHSTEIQNRMSCNVPAYHPEDETHGFPKECAKIYSKRLPHPKHIPCNIGHESSRKEIIDFSKKEM
jgi:hypothetical protein